MSWMDAINGLFEGAAALAIGLHVAQIHRDRAVKGVSWIATAFFTVWGFWNLVYYPALEQVWSAVAGAAVAAMNLVYLHAIWRFWERRS